MQHHNDVASIIEDGGLTAIYVTGESNGRVTSLAEAEDLASARVAARTFVQDDGCDASVVWHKASSVCGFHRTELGEVRQWVAASRSLMNELGGWE